MRWEHAMGKARFIPSIRIICNSESATALMFRVRRKKKVNCAELKQFDFTRGAAEARSVKLRFALAQEGCSKACLDGELDVWHGQSAHSSLRSSLPSWSLHLMQGDPVRHVA